MRKLLLGLALFLGSVVAAQAQNSVAGPPNQIACNNVATYTGTAALATLITALNSSAHIFICGWHMTNTATSGSWQFEYGTGTNCGTNTTVFTPAMEVTSTAPSADHVDYAQIMIPAGQNLCQNSTATVTGIVYYATF